tara:strand:- start:235 stop:363 length:129 start_codon:yes stop_codon:yes gene_type:complete
MRESFFLFHTESEKKKGHTFGTFFSILFIQRLFERTAEEKRL